MKIVIATPTRGNPDDQFLECRDMLVAELKKRGHEVQIMTSRGSSLIDHARSTMATAFLDDPQNHDVLLWIDDDMIFDAQEIAEMCLDACMLQAIVGAASMAKRPQGHVNFIPSPDCAELKFFENSDIYGVLSVGTGICAVHRNVFERMLQLLPDVFPRIMCGNQPTYPFYANIIHEGQWYGEDSSFCVRARQAGCSVYVDARCRVFHKGPYLYGLEDSGNMLDRAGTLTMKFRNPG